ncbi:MAG TPA: maleylpyruvate isomerase family mycothiol-dependent enzyme [Micromonosporaceae bacterium]|nr:maleylpyruvate isomerase family mycothiol-dependent enzyme [Micromonosporaceae bacterium]
MDELADLAREQEAFAGLLHRVGDEWDRPSSAAGWSIRDQVAHLADTEEVAADTLTGGARTFAEAVSAYPNAEQFTAAGCRRGDGRSAAELVAWWAAASARTRDLLADRDPDERVAWGFGMPTRTFVAARLMEHWAHGLDIADSLAIPTAEAPRLRHVAALGLATLRYALAVARVPWPAGRTLRLELAGADGARYQLGAADATDVLSGPLLGWCRIATRRAGRLGADPPGGLTANGELAELAMTHARAYL